MKHTDDWRGEHLIRAMPARDRRDFAPPKDRKRERFTCQAAAYRECAEAGLTLRQAAQRLCVTMAAIERAETRLKIRFAR